MRFTTAAQLVNELTEAKNKSELNRVTNRWTRCELIVIDEMAYVAMPEAAAELLFQIIAGRAERAAVIVTTNLPFSEWTTMFPNARLCKAMLDRLTDQAHIIETGTESYRFRRTLEKKKGGKGMKEGTKTGDVVGRPSGRSLFLGDPGAIFSCGKLGTGTKKEKRSKKERKRRPVETDATDGNPQRTRIPTAAWKAQSAFHSSHKARRRFHRRT